MPTLNPRVNVTLTPSLDSLLARLAGLERISKAQVLRELLEAAEPSLQRAVATMEAAVAARKESRQGLARGMAESQQVLEEQLEKNLLLLEAHSRDLVSEAEAVRGRRPSRKGLARELAGADALGPKNPPSSNRGVKSPEKGENMAKTSAVLLRVRGSRS